MTWPTAQIHPLTPFNVDILAKPATLKKYDLAGPRYTSYPTAPQFTSNFTQQHWQAAVSSGNKAQKPLSLYFHIPFCDTVCYYCGCNKIITANKAKSTPYLTAIIKEMDLVAAQVDTTRPVQQLHFGGGTPTFLSDEQLTTLMNAVKARFNVADSAFRDFSIEVHPAGVTPQRIKHLRTIGFNRVSMGIQDFSPDVQKAVNRFNSPQQVGELVAAVRENNFASLSMDLIYGLPKQTAESFAETLQKIIALSPDRIALFNYAHLPHLFKTQKQINARELPEPQEKLIILQQSIQSLCNAGYQFIGMDHFAKVDDSLAVAQRKGELHRNFQGYSTHGDCDLLAFGVSSISSIGNTYSQNSKNLTEYYAAINTNQLPIIKGLTLTDDDLLRREVISQIICNFELDYKKINRQFGVDVAQYFADALTELKVFEEDGLIEFTQAKLHVKPCGRLLVRRICMAFDSYVSSSVNSHVSQQQTANTPQYSRIL